MFRRERERWMQLLEDEREAHRKERQELLNRLVEPRVVVDAPREPRVAVPPHEPIELAYIGREVPAGVTVGVERNQNGDTESA